jgi:hypothetical protein
MSDKNKIRTKGAGVARCDHLNKLFGNNIALLIAGETTCEGQLLLLALDDADETSGGDVENVKYGI